MVASSSEAAHRRTAMESRTGIDMAVGIIMAQNRCTPEQAIAMLKSASSDRNVKLRALAQDLVTSTGGTEPATAFDS